MKNRKTSTGFFSFLDSRYSTNKRKSEAVIALAETLRKASKIDESKIPDYSIKKNSNKRAAKAKS